MSDSFLEEQVRRIRQLTERMSQVTNRTHVEEEIARDRAAFGHGPLHAVRDVRVVDSSGGKATAGESERVRRRRRR